METFSNKLFLFKFSEAEYFWIEGSKLKLLLGPADYMRKIDELGGERDEDDFVKLVLLDSNEVDEKAEYDSY